MRITPLDVRKQEFRRGMRGYDADEVRAFLANLADEYEAVLVDNKQLRERILEQDDRLTEYRTLEKTLRDTLMTAEKLMQDTKENARRQGELLIQEARQRVQQSLAEGRARLEEMRRDAMAVHREKDTFLARFRSLAEAQIEFVESHRSDFRDLDGRLLEWTEGGKPAAQSAPRTASAAPPRHDETPGAPPAPRAAAATERDNWRDYQPGAGRAQPAVPQEARRIAEAVQTPEVPAAREPEAKT